MISSNPIEEYLAFERASETKHEYYAGGIFAMVGASEAHVLIVTNVVTGIGSQLKGRPCLQIESCTDYLLIAQDAFRVEHHARQPDGTWRHTVAAGPKAVLPLPSIGCELRLEDVYDKASL